MFQGGQCRDSFFFFTSSMLLMGSRESENTFNPDITEVKVIVSGIPNKFYSQGMETRDMWEEAFRRFGRENSALNAADFYVALLIDLRSMSDNGFLESGLRLVNMIEGVQLVINRKALGSGNVICHIFILPDAQLSITNCELESMSY